MISLDTHARQISHEELDAFLEEKKRKTRRTMSMTMTRSGAESFWGFILPKDIIEVRDFKKWTTADILKEKRKRNEANLERKYFKRNIVRPGFVCVTKHGLILKCAGIKLEICQSLGRIKMDAIEEIPMGIIALNEKEDFPVWRKIAFQHGEPCENGKARKYKGFFVFNSRAGYGNFKRFFATREKAEKWVEQADDLKTK